MKRPPIQIKLDIYKIQQLLKGKNLKYQIGEDEINIYPPQEGMFLTYEEIEKIVDKRVDAQMKFLNYLQEEK